MNNKKNLHAQTQNGQEATRGLSYMQLVESALEGIWVIDEHTITTYVNNSLCKLLGNSPDEMLNKPFSDFIAPDERQDHQQRMDARREGVEEVYERCFIRKDGQEVWMSVSAKPVFYEDGLFAGSFAHLTNITAAKKRERMTRVIMATLADLAKLTEVDQVYQMVGSKTHEIFPDAIVGLVSVDEVEKNLDVTHLFGIGETYHDLVKRFNIDPTKIHFPLKDVPLYELEIFRSGKFQAFEGGLYPLLMKKISKSKAKVAEKELKINFINMMGFVSEGDFFGGIIVASQSDLSAYLVGVESIVFQATQVIKRLHSERITKLSEDRLQKTFDAIEDAYWDWDIPSGKIIVNDKWYTMLGYEPGEFPATYDEFIKLLHPDDLQNTNLQIEESLKTSKENYSVEFRLKMKSGEFKHILSRGKIITTDGSGSPIRMIGTHVDISGQKRLEEAKELFYKTQRNLLQVTNLDELYQLVGNSLIKLVPDSYAVITNYDENTKLIKIAGFFGFGKALEKLMKHFRLSFSSFDVRIEDIEEDVLDVWQSNSLVRYEYGLYGLLTKKIPQPVCQSAEQMLNIQEIYVMGCRWNRQDFGGFVLLLKKGMGENKEYVESLINDTAIAIQRILTEEKSRISQARFRNIFEKSPVGIVTIGPDLKFISSNDEFCNFTGYQESEITGLGIKDIIDPEYIKNDLSQINALLEGKIGVFAAVSRFMRKNGETVWGRILVNNVSDSLAGDSYLLTMITDISKQMIADEAVKENQRFLELVLDTIPNYVFVRDIDGRYRLSNKSFAEAMGTTPEEIVGKSDIDLGDRYKLAEAVHEQDKEILKSGKGWINPDMEIYFPNIGSKPVLMEKRPLPNAENKKPAVLGVITDLSEQKKIEKALQESEERYRILVESSPEGVMLVQQGKFIYANKSALNLFGYKAPHDLVGKEVLQFIHPDSRKTMVEKIFESAENFPHSLAEIKIVQQNGKIGEVEAVSTQVIINSEPTTLFFAQDITDRKLAEKQIKQRTEDLILLKKLNDSVNRGDPLQKSLANLEEDTKKIFSSWGASIYTLSSDKKFLELQSYQLKTEIIPWIEERIGRKIPPVKIKLDSNSIYNKILTNKKFTVIDDRETIIQLMNEFTDIKLIKRVIPAIFKKLDIHSVISIPIISNDESVGLLELSSDEPFKEDDLNRLELISSELGSILRRKQAESALKDSEENFRQIVERSNDIFLREDFRTLRIEYISPIVNTLLGYDVQNMIGMELDSIIKYIHPDDLHKFEGLRENLLKNWREGDRNYSLEYRLKNIQGDFKWFVGNYSLLMDDSGKPKTIMCTLVDITERKYNELTLQFRLKLMQLSSKLTMQELLHAILDEMEVITDSRFGFYYVLDENEKNIEQHVWSVEKAHLPGNGIDLDQESSDFYGNTWRECLKQRRPLIYNDAEAFPKGMNTAEMPFSIRRELIVPVVRDDKFVSILGIGNKETSYSLNDLTMVSKLADLAWDIVENKKIETELQESEAIFNAFMENSPVYIFFKDKEIRSINLSRNYEQLLKRPLDQLLYKTMDEVFPSALAKSMIEDDRSVLENAKPKIVDEEFNGRYFTTIKFPIFIDGSPEFVAGFTIDNTERVLSEKKLAESEEMYRLISSVVSDYLFSTRMTEENELDLQWVAGAFESITGYTLPEYKAMGGWRKAVYAEDKAIDDRDMQNLMQNKKVITEIRTIKKDGSLCWVRTYSQPIWDEKNNCLIGINGAVQDITERKKAEEEIQKSAREFKTLYDTAKDFSLHRDPYMILQTICDRACALFGVANAFVYIYNPETKELELKFNKTSPDSLGRKIKLGEGISGVVAEKKVPLFANDYPVARQASRT